MRPTPRPSCDKASVCSTRRRTPGSDDTRASGPALARRLPATTSRRVGRAYASSTVSGRRACRTSCGPSSDAGNNPCSRQGDRVVAPGSMGAGCWLRTTTAPPAGADVQQPDGVAAGVGGPSSSHRARVHGWTSGGGGSPATLRTITRRSAAAGLRSLSPAVAVVGTRSDGALACRRRAGVSVEPSPPRQCAAVARAAAHVALAAMRAMTHVDGKVIGSSRRPRRRAALLAKDTCSA